MRTFNGLLLLPALAAVLLLCACGGDGGDVVFEPGDSDSDSESQSDDSESESAEDSESQSEATSDVTPGTECAEEAAHRCADAYTLYTCTGGVWVLAATCTDSGMQCQNDACVEPEEPCEEDTTRCNGDINEVCSDLGVFVVLQDCSKLGLPYEVHCSYSVCSNGYNKAACYNPGETCAD